MAQIPAICYFMALEMLMCLSWKHRSLVPMIVVSGRLPILDPTLLKSYLSFISTLLRLNSNLVPALLKFDGSFTGPICS